MVQIMVLGAVIAVSGTMIMKMNKNQIKVQTLSVQKQNLSKYINKIEASLFDYNICSKLVQPTATSVVLDYDASNIGPTAPPAITELDNKFIDENNKNLFENNFYQFALNENSPNLNDFKIFGWVISDISIKRVLPTEPGDTYLDVTFLKTDQETYGANRVTKSIKLDVEYEADNKTFIRCFSDRKNAIRTAIYQAKEDICVKDMYGTWDGSSCDIGSLLLDLSPVVTLTKSGTKTRYLGSTSKYKSCYLVTAGKTWSTKTRENRAHRCYIEQTGSSFYLKAAEAHSHYVCKAQCVGLKE